MKYLKPNEGLKIFDIKFDVTTAGPSPNDNKRIELFLLGCHKAASGHPCKGCFNSPLWNANIAEFSRDPVEIAQWIIERTPENERYITLGGGEPTDQIDHLIPLCKELRKANFHIMMYTWRELVIELRTKGEFRDKLLELFKYIDMIVDGQFQIENKLYQEDAADGLLSSIGSGNQIIWDLRQFIGYAMEDLNAIRLDENNKIIFDVKE